MAARTLLMAFLPLAAVATLDPSCRPGGNFDLSPWTLQLPISNGDGSVLQVSSSKLEGCKTGYEDPNREYFFTESKDGALVMKAPGNPTKTQCAHTPHSSHCRTELSENINWDPKQPLNRLNATLAVPTPGPSTCIGQIHIDEDVSKNKKPAAELYYNSDGDLSLGVQNSVEGNQAAPVPVTNIPVGETFTYEIRYENGELSVGINGEFQSFDTHDLDSPSSYFKVGNYNQAKDETESDIHFFQIDVYH